MVLQNKLLSCFISIAFLQDAKVYCLVSGCCYS